MITQEKRKDDVQQYTAMPGVSSQTAQQLGQAQQQGYQPSQAAQQAQQKAQSYASGYQPGQQTQQAQQMLQQIQSQKPQDYASQYTGQLNDILQQIQGQKPFKYEFNQDALFRSLSDIYTQKGKQASLDAQGQAAGLTGGYGNSYGQLVGTQAYQQALTGLYDKGMDLAQMAYNRYQGEQADRYNQMNLLMDLENQGYNRYRDTVGDWERERDYLTGRADTEAERDYQRWAADRGYWTDLAQTEDQKAYDRYRQDLDYWTGLAQVENQAYESEAARQEAIRQYEQNFAEQVRQAELDEAYRRDQLLEQQRGTNLDESYRRDTLDEQKRQAELDEAYRRDTLAEQARGTDLDEAYRRAALAEQARGTDLDEAYRRDSLAENTRQFNASLAEQIRSTDMDEAYRRDTLAEQKRQADLDEAYRQQQFAESVRQFEAGLDWDKLSAGQKYAAEYVMAILENGQMPSEALLEQAGLSAEDAAKMMAQLEVTTGGGTGGTSKKTNNGGMTYLDAGARDYILNPNNAAQIQKYSRQANEKIVNDALKNGQLPAANNVYNAGMNETDVMKKYMQNSALLNPTPEEMMKKKLGIGG